jgi:hypothetical protein
MKLCGRIGRNAMLILVDSGRVGTFISDQLAHQLQLHQLPCAPSQFVLLMGVP